MAKISRMREIPIVILITKEIISNIKKLNTINKIFHFKVNKKKNNCFLKLKNIKKEILIISKINKKVKFQTKKPKLTYIFQKSRAYITKLILSKIKILILNKKVNFKDFKVKKINMK